MQLTPGPEKVKGPLLALMLDTPVRGIEHVPPREQEVALMVIAEFASAELGMGLAETANVGVVSCVVTEGTSHAGQLPVDAIKSVTVPVPAAPQVPLACGTAVPVQDPEKRAKISLKIAFLETAVFRL
jgi:hypothetical protein